MTELERFQRWEDQLNTSVKFTEKEAEWARKKAIQLDRAGLTKWPTTQKAPG